MTRPRKQTVDYFPHSCNHGQTMFVIEQRYGNDGYAFWFKLLEMLGKTTGHYLDLEKITTLEFLASVTRVEPDICIEILSLLARLEAIDGELWESKVVWSDNFVNGIADAYRNRVLETPKRPDNLRKKPGMSGVSDTENPQRKVKERKEKDSKDKSLCQNPADFDPTNGLNVQTLAKLWNEKAPPELSKVNLPFKRSPKAMTKIKDALKRNPDEDWWAKVMERVYQSPFLRGEKGWKASIDFVVGKAEEILDGKYDGSKVSRAASGAVEWLESRRGTE